MIRRALTPYRIACATVALISVLALHHRLGELHQQYQLAQAVQTAQQHPREVANAR